MNQVQSAASDVHEAMRFEVNDPAATRDDRNAALDVARVDTSLHDLIDTPEALAGHADRFRFGHWDLVGPMRLAESNTPKRQDRDCVGKTNPVFSISHRLHHALKDSDLFSAVEQFNNEMQLGIGRNVYIQQ